MRAGDNGHLEHSNRQLQYNAIIMSQVRVRFTPSELEEKLYCLPLQALTVCPAFPPGISISISTTLFRCISAKTLTRPWMLTRAVRSWSDKLSKAALHSSLEISTLVASSGTSPNRLATSSSWVSPTLIPFADNNSSIIALACPKAVGSTGSLISNETLSVVTRFNT